jgi:hypothetical protein
VQAANGRDPRTLCLFDLAADERVVVKCRCGSIVEYPEDLLQRRYRIPSSTLIFDLQYRFRCRHCNATKGFAIQVCGDPTGNSSIPRRELVIVAMET